MNLAQHFHSALVASTESAEQAWSDEDEAQLHELLASCEAHTQKLQDCDNVAQLLSEAQGINRYIAERMSELGMEQMDFEVFPIASFTEQPSGVNLSPALESFDQYKKVLIAGGIAGLLLLIAKFVKWLIGRGDDDDSTPSGSADSQNQAHDASRAFSKRLKNHERSVDKASRKAERETRGRAVPAPHPNQVMQSVITNPEDLPDDLKPQPFPKKEDAPSPEELKNHFLSYGAERLGDLYYTTVNRVIKDPRAQVNVDQLIDFQQAGGLLNNAAKVVEYMNRNLDTIKRLFDSIKRKALKYDRDPGGSTFGNPKARQGDTRNRTPLKINKKLTEPLMDNEHPMHEELTNGFKLVDDLMRNFEMHQQMPESNMGNMKLGNKSPTYARDGENADPQQVSKEVFDTLTRLAADKERYQGPDLASPRKDLKAIHDWLTKERKRLEANPTGEDDRAVDDGLAYLQQAVTKFSSQYAHVSKIFKTYHDEHKKVTFFLVSFTKTYPKVLSESIVRFYENYGYEPMEYREEKREIEKLLKFG